MTVDARAERSRQEIRAALARLHAASRREIQAATGLSASTVAGVVRAMMADGVVREIGPAQVRGRGRPVTRLVLDDRPGHVVGIDIGHRHVAVALATSGEQVLGERWVDNDGTDAADELLRQAADLVAELLEEHGIESRLVEHGVIAVPAPVEPATGRVHVAPIVVPTWRGRRPAQELQQLVGFELTPANDANAGAMGERVHGVGAGIDDLVYLNATVGVGAGLILGGRLYTGPDGAAGEIGHIRLPGASALCRCAQYGCLESEASLRALTPRLAAVGVEVGPIVQHDELRDCAGQPAVHRLLVEAGRGLGNVLADMCNLLSPAMIIVGGELAAGGAPVRDGIAESLERHALSTIARTVRIEFSTLGPRAPMRGAVALAAQQARLRGPG
ncbi:ROK family protein [Aeromicrobium sp. CF4.19]|uniref:ROK family protein n=1 Tax=Aeromicrobium sp. CF4.19 TaxID=3373082 RepID=UPI003EE7277F